MGFKIKNKENKKGFKIKVVPKIKSDFKAEEIGNEVFRSYPFEVLRVTLNIGSRGYGECLNIKQIQKLQRHILDSIDNAKHRRQYWTNFMPAVSLLDFILNTDYFRKYFDTYSESYSRQVLKNEKTNC